MFALLARPLAGIVLCLSLTAAPALAQYMFLDANGDGVNTSADLVNPVGTTTLEVWLRTNTHRDGSPAACPTGEELTINTYEFILKATNGQMNWLSYTNHMTESTLSFGLGSNATEYHNGFGGGPILPAGTYHLGTLAVSVALGTPSLSFAVATVVNGGWFTSFGSQCPGVDFDNTMKLGYDWFESDGAAYGGSPQAPPVLAPIADMTANEGEIAQQTITATDPDQQPLQFLKVSGPLHMTVATTVPGSGAATGVITLAPGPVDQGASAATVRVTDGVASDERSFNITIVDTSPHYPVLYAESPVSVGVGQERQFSVQVTDPDHDPLTLSFAGRPSFVPNFLFGPSEGVGGIGSAYFVGPAPGDVGRSFVVLEATDGTEVAYARVEINVAGAPLPPPPPPDLFSAGYTVQEVGGPPTGIGMGDLDGDGDADAAIASTAAGLLEIWASDGRGGLDLVERIQAPRAGAVAVGDFDRDGVDDVACAELGTGDIVVYRGPFTGATALSQRLHVGGGLASLAIADVDRIDGVDLLAVQRGSARLVRFLNDGAGTFGAAIEEATSPNPLTLTTADFDADGWLDVAVFCESPAVFDIFTNRGDGGFLSPATQPIDALNTQETITPLSAVAYDDDGDGDLDIGVATGKWVVVLSRGSNGRFFNGLYRFGGMTSVATADLHATGHGDLLGGSGVAPDFLGNQAGNYVSVHSPYGHAGQSIPQPGGRITGIASGDVDRDGRPDVITIQDWSKTGIAAVYRTQSDGQLGSAKVISAYDLYGTPVLGDFNNDGHLDIVGGATTLLGAGDGTFPTKLHPNTYFGSDATMHAADLNGDGFLDIIAVPFCCDNVYPRLGDGTGNFVAPSVATIITGQNQNRGFALGDFDEDGAVDFVVSSGTWRGSESDLQWEVWRGVGDGTFHPPTFIPAGKAASELRAFDFDSDGHLDLSFTRQHVWGLRGRGDGTFGELEALVVAQGGAWGVGWGDLNGDSRPDLAFNRASPMVLLAASLQLSDRTFAAPRPSWTQGQASYADQGDIHVVDMNGDGRSDIVTPYAYGLGVGLGNGSGVVSRRRIIGPVGSGHIMIEDIDEDGWPDIVAGGNYQYGVSNPIVIFHNNSDLVNRRAARAFLPGGDKTVPIGATGRNLCLRVEPVDGSYQNVELDPMSIVMKSTGTGSVSQITAVAGKKLVLGDTDGNGVEELDACFEAEKLERLFSAVQGRRTLPVVIEGRVLGGGRMHAELSLTIVRAGAPAAPSLSPNPLNPSGVFRFATTRPGKARIQLFDVQGRLVRTIVDRQLPAGEQEVSFDGKDRAGRSLASGIYYARIETPDGEFRHRVAIVK